MENNNQDLLCCVRDMFGGCAGTPSSPNLRYMFAAVMQKDTDGCFSLKTSPVLESFDIVDCNNTISTVQSSGVVIEGVTAPIPVCIQGEKDFEQVYKCDLVTGNTILIRTVLNHDTNLFVTTYYDLVLGVDWVGNPADLTECTSNTLESDKVKLCDDNGEFYRWFVKDNGEPTGVSYDTDLSGAPYVPVGAVVECSDSGDIVECTTTTGGNAVTEATDTNLNGIASVIVGGGGSTIFHTMLGNPGLNYVGDGTTGAMIGGINVSVAAPIIGAQFTITLDSPLDDDPLENSDLVPVVWSNTYSTSVTATSITTPLIYSGTDVQGSGLNMPIYGYPDPISGPYTIVWTGDLPVGDYTVAFINQNQSAADNVIVSITHNIVEGGTTVTTKAQLTALDQCTIDALTPTPVVDPILVPGGAIIINTAAMSVIAPANTRSFSVKPLITDTAGTPLTVTPLYDISFDNGTTWLLNIDGGDTNGEGNRYQIDVSQVQIRPSSIVPNQRVYIKWDRV